MLTFDLTNIVRGSLDVSDLVPIVEVACDAEVNQLDVSLTGLPRCQQDILRLWEQRKKKVKQEC